MSDSASELRNVILLGDCLDRLKELPDACVDSVVTDPPYGLGNREPTVEEIIAFLTVGASLDTKGDFMGKKWEIPSVAVWKEVYRVLKPGGHVLCFAGTRTWDLMALGLRAAGFEFRDTIADEFGTPVLQWCYGSGFPKSLNVSKAIDKHLGVAGDRKVVGIKPGHEDFANRTTSGHLDFVTNSGLTGFDRPWMHDPEKQRAYHLQTSSASEEAKRFEGFGTALKPSWEPILVFRKPLDGTVVETVLKHGTGALNIDGTRIPTNGEQLSISSSDPFHNADGSQRWNPTSSGAIDREQHSRGRFPPNLTLTHHPDCKQVGTQKLKGDQRGDPGGKRPGGFGDVGAEKGDEKPNARVYGNETVPVYECAEGCPVKEMGEQSGKLKSGFMGAGEVKDDIQDTYGDEGTATRFFPSFEGQEPPDATFFYCAKAAAKETTLGGRVENDHPTRKPLKLMQWLVRLVTPKGGLVLDPYCGSGSTLHAAVLERADYLGIEKHEPYHQIATARLAIVQEEEGAVHDQMDAFDAIMNGVFDDDE